MRPKVSNVCEIKKTVNNDVLNCARQIIKMAESGDLQGLAFVGELGGDMVRGYGGKITTSLIGEFEIQKHAMIADTFMGEDGD